MLKVKVHAANITECEGGKLLLEPFKDRTLLRRSQHIWLDSGYKDGFDEWVHSELGWSAEIVKHPPKPRAPCS